MKSLAMSCIRNHFVISCQQCGANEECGGHVSSLRGASRSGRARKDPHSTHRKWVPTPSSSEEDSEGFRGGERSVGSIEVNRALQRTSYVRNEGDGGNR